MYRSFFAGIKAALPAAISLIPLGISIGLVTAPAGLNWLETGLMSMLVMSASAQIMAIGMLLDGIPFYAVLFSVFCLIQKNLILSAAVMHRLGPLPIWRKLICCFGLCDTGAAIFGLSEDTSEAFWMGINWVIIISITLSAIAGVLMMGALPAVITNSFGIAMYALFLSMIVPQASRNTRLGLLVIFTGALNWALRLVTSTAWALIISMLLGAFVGVFFVDLDGDKKEA